MPTDTDQVRRLAAALLEARNAASLAVAIIDNGGDAEKRLAEVRAELVRGFDGGLPEAS